MSKKSSRAILLLLGLSLAMSVQGLGTSSWANAGGTDHSALSQQYKVTEYEVPTPNSLPHDAAVDAKDIVWFTEMNANKIGRFDPATGQFKEWPSPSGPTSQPYGIACEPSGIIWYNESGADKMVRFDPKTESFTTVPIPTKGTVVRYFELDSRQRPWLAQSGAANKIGKVE